jgi:hypothetical protein
MAPEYFPFAGWTGGRVGIVAISRTMQREHGMKPASDEAGAWFGQLPGLQKMNPYYLIPPPGTCTSQAEPWKGGIVPGPSLISHLATHAGAKALLAGDEISIDDGKTLRKVPGVRGQPGLFDRELSDPFGRPDRLLNFGSPAVLHVTGKGGADVGRFGFALEGPQPFEMRGAMGPVKRGQALRLEWTDMGASRIAIAFANFVDEETGAQGMCYCVGTPGATGLTIPASALAYFPPSATARISLTVAAWPLLPVAFRATGLDHAVAVSAFMQATVLEPGRKE